ncbi:MAG: 5-formyltetrahydrofolate cyclo-ligase [Gammaproteobacteria bacterium]|nr:5-formyltetrahydrofolate cyclo-ligase [Gammaproteobacteria bacterium]
MSTGSERNELRRYFRDKRRSLSEQTQRNNSLHVARHLLNTGQLLRGNRFGGYWANDGEVELGPLLVELDHRRRDIALPVVNRRGRMSFFRYRPGAPIVINRYNIPEPAPGAAFINGRSIDLVLVPLVAFDEFGVRLGMGAGYYDRYLGSLPVPLRPRVVGVAHEAQRSPDPLPFDDWDVPMDGVVTEHGWQPFD